MAKYDLSGRETPPKGAQEGVFADVVDHKVTDKRGKQYRAVTFVGQLGIKKSNGQRFTIRATYNLENNAGIRNLVDDLKIWRGGADVTLQDLDFEVELLNKAFTCNPIVSEENGVKVLRMRGYHPVPDSKLTVSENFVREKDKQAPANEGAVAQTAVAATAAV